MHGSANYRHSATGSLSILRTWTKEENAKPAFVGVHVHVPMIMCDAWACDKEFCVSCANAVRPPLHGYVA
jgi:hypothetical protein